MKAILVGLIVSAILSMFGPVALQAAGDDPPGGSARLIYMAGDDPPGGS